jgi:MerR family transcriptional regulator/heat shock protein HspR
MIHDQGISIPGLKRLLALAPCWEMAECPSEIHEHCSALVDWAAPRTIREAGNEEAERQAKAADRALKMKKKKGQKRTAP